MGPRREYQPPERWGQLQTITVSESREGLQRKHRNLHPRVLQYHLGSLAVIPGGRGKRYGGHAQEGNGQQQSCGSHADPIEEVRMLNKYIYVGIASSMRERSIKCSGVGNHGVLWLGVR